MIVQIKKLPSGGRDRKTARRSVPTLQIYQTLEELSND